MEGDILLREEHIRHFRKHSGQDNISSLKKTELSEDFMIS